MVKFRPVILNCWYQAKHLQSLTPTNIRWNILFVFGFLASKLDVGYSDLRRKFEFKWVQIYKGCPRKPYITYIRGSCQACGHPHIYARLLVSPWTKISGHASLAGDLSWLFAFIDYVGKWKLLLYWWRREGTRNPSDTGLRIRLGLREGTPQTQGCGSSWV